MRYLCLACGDEAAWEKLTEAQQEEMAKKCRVHDERLAGDDAVTLYAGLMEGGSVIRTRGGKRMVTDGPFVESKEIGGVFIVEADDLEEAVRVASMHPAAQMGEELDWYVVVRPLFEP